MFVLVKDQQEAQRLIRILDRQPAGLDQVWSSFYMMSLQEETLLEK